MTMSNRGTESSNKKLTQNKVIKSISALTTGRIINQVPETATTVATNSDVG